MSLRESDFEATWGTLLQVLRRSRSGEAVDSAALADFSLRCCAAVLDYDDAEPSLPWPQLLGLAALLWRGLANQCALPATQAALGLCLPALCDVAGSLDGDAEEDTTKQSALRLLSNACAAHDANQQTLWVHAFPHGLARLLGGAGDGAVACGLVHTLSCRSGERARELGSELGWALVHAMLTRITDKDAFQWVYFCVTTLLPLPGVLARMLHVLSSSFVTPSSSSPSSSPSTSSPPSPPSLSWSPPPAAPPPALRALVDVLEAYTDKLEDDSVEQTFTRITQITE